MSASHDYAELGELIFICLNGEANAGQMAQLEARLAADERARRYYGEFLVIYAGLRQSSASLLGSVASETPIAVQGPSKGAIRSIGRTPPRDEPEVVNGDPRPRQFRQQDETMREIEAYARRQLEAFLDQQHREEVRGHYDRLGWDLADVAASIAQAMRSFLGTVARVVKVGAIIAAVVLVGLIIGLHVHANRVIATLADSTDASWETSPADVRLRRGWMRLEQGFAQIAFKKGTTVIVQAPCQFELRSSNSMFLEEGRVTAYVPERASGFSVSTPTSCVIDFGTEFGLLSGGGGGDEVHVFDGSVRFTSVNRRRATRWDKSLKKGQAATVDAAGQVHVQALRDRPSQFVRTLPDEDRFDQLVSTLPETDESGPLARQADDADPSLVGWWKFDEGSGTVAGDSSSHGHTGTVVGAEWAAGGWNQDGYCLNFDYDDEIDRVDLGTMDVFGSGITITAWINPDSFRQHDARVISKSSTGATADGHWWMLGTNEGGHVRFRIKTNEGNKTLTLIDRAGVLSVGEWQFIAGRWDGHTAFTYVGNVETGWAPKGGSAVATNSSIPVAIGNQPANDPDGPRAWDGLIDEVRVYSRALTVEELAEVMTGACSGTAAASASEPIPGEKRTVDGPID